MKVLHITKTPIAGAPGLLSDITNRLSLFNSKIFAGQIKSGGNDFSCDYSNILCLNELRTEVEVSDIIHFHNTCPDEWPFIDTDRIPFVVQLHSEPGIIGRLNRKYKGKHKVITIAQKHALLYRDLDYGGLF